MGVVRRRRRRRTATTAGTALAVGVRPGKGRLRGAMRRCHGGRQWLGGASGEGGLLPEGTDLGVECYRLTGERHGRAAYCFPSSLLRCNCIVRIGESGWEGMTGRHDADERKGHDGRNWEERAGDEHHRRLSLTELAPQAGCRCDDEARTITIVLLSREVALQSLSRFLTVVDEGGDRRSSW